MGGALMKKIFLALLILTGFSISSHSEDYTVGIGDVIAINLLQPEQSNNQSTVSPGGEISVPYIGSVKVKGKTLDEIQKLIQEKLVNGYLKYPVVTISLVQSHSRNFTVTGEVVRPGTYPLNENTTVLKAISEAGGFTKFGSSSHVKVLRPKKDKPGYNSIDVNIKEVMDGKSDTDILIIPGDIIIVSESLF
jgi:protein involved in polysaccharide export with SLBB domain